MNVLDRAKKIVREVSSQGNKTGWIVVSEDALVRRIAKELEGTSLCSSCHQAEVEAAIQEYSAASLMYAHFPSMANRVRYDNAKKRVDAALTAKPKPTNYEMHVEITVKDGDWQGTLEDWQARYNR